MFCYLYLNAEKNKLETLHQKKKKKEREQTHLFFFVFMYKCPHCVCHVQFCMQIALLFQPNKVGMCYVNVPVTTKMLVSKYNTYVDTRGGHPKTEPN